MGDPNQRRWTYTILQVEFVLNFQSIIVFPFTDSYLNAVLLYSSEVHFRKIALKEIILICLFFQSPPCLRYLKNVHK